MKEGQPIQMPKEVIKPPQTVVQGQIYPIDKVVGYQQKRFMMRSPRNGKK